MAETKQKMDVRTYSRYVEKGLLKDSEIQSHLKSLPDEAENAVWVDPTAEEEELSVEETESEADSAETDVTAETQTVVEGA
ncbi:MAG: hypothetical protein EBR01_05240 [Proteobacteria bacterium]|jgi:hypothetical protein|nr:hypothetical protein [Pseudomonadota bacterium]